MTESLKGSGAPDARLTEITSIGRVPASRTPRKAASSAKADRTSATDQVQCCDVLILAGASAAQFPGKPSVQAVFNHNVRAELGLPNWLGEVERQLARFRGLIHAAPQVLITYAASEDDESAQLCPWAEALKVTGLAGVDTTLPALAASGQAEISATTTLPEPEPPEEPSDPSR